MSELQANNFQRVVTLRDYDASLTVSLTIEDLELLRVRRELKEPVPYEPYEPLPFVPVIVDFRFEYHMDDGEPVIVTNRQICSVGGDEVFEVLDLSICLVHLSRREDTTEELVDLMAPPDESPEGEETYTHSVEWMMHQDFLGNAVRMKAIRTEEGQSIRRVYFDFSTESRELEHYTDTEGRKFEQYVVLEPSVEELLDFAAQLRQCYDDLLDVIWLG